MITQKQNLLLSEDELRVLNKYRTMSLKYRKAWEQDGDNILVHQIANTKTDDNVVFTDKWQAINKKNP